MTNLRNNLEKIQGERVIDRAYCTCSGYLSDMRNKQEYVLNPMAAESEDQPEATLHIALRWEVPQLEFGHLVHETPGGDAKPGRLWSSCRCSGRSESCQCTIPL